MRSWFQMKFDQLVGYFTHMLKLRMEVTKNNSFVQLSCCVALGKAAIIITGMITTY